MPEPSPTPQTPPSRQLSPNPFIVAAILLVIGLIGFGGYRASEYQGMQTLRTDAGHRLDLFAAAVDGIVNRYAHIPATIQLNEEVLNVMHHAAGPGQRAGGQPLPAAPQRAHRQHCHLRGGRARHRAWPPATGTTRTTASSARTCPSAATTWTALAGRVGRHFAIGITRGEPGYFVSHPIRQGNRVVGVAVIKISLGQLDKAWDLLGAPALIADGNGVVILSSVPEWRYTALTPLPLDTRVDISMSRLYNGGPSAIFRCASTRHRGRRGRSYT
jgi:C4-dicarboxylate-specific signal transduction histidine kinase